MMSVLKQNWLQRRNVAHRSKPSIGVRVARIRFLKRTGSFLVAIRGAGLRPAAIPPSVSVGDVRATHLIFSSDGHELTGMLPRLPDARDLVVDLGFDRHERELPSRVTVVPSLRYAWESFVDFWARLGTRKNVWA
jgi:hypothetical protein